MKAKFVNETLYGYDYRSSGEKRTPKLYRDTKQKVKDYIEQTNI